MSDNKKIDVVFTIDESYIQHFSVALISLLENNNHIIREVFLIIDAKFNTDLLHETIDLIFKKYSKNIFLKRIDDSLFKSFRITSHITLATYYRIYIADIFSTEHSKILFLDSDIVIQGDISEILACEFTDDDISSEYYVYAANHMYPPELLNRLRQLGLTSNLYFNAGILLINLDLWRSKNISQKAIDFIDKNNDNLLCWDQDVLNVLFDGNFGLLDPKFNVFEEALKVVKNPIIIHYTGSLKPWHYLSKHPYKDKYYYYLQLTPFQSFKYKDKNLKYIIEKYLPERIRKVLKPWYHKIRNL